MKEFNDLLKKWLGTPADQRDYTVGALYLLQLTGNQILYKNLMADLDGRRAYIEQELTEHLRHRCHACEVNAAVSMLAEVAAITDTHISLAKEQEQRHLGRRDDHDSLPEELQRRYAEIPDLRRRMAELHTRLRMMDTDNSPRPAAELRPLVAELRALDTKIRRFWADYDKA